MEIAGSVSGGCIEGAVIEAGLACLESGVGTSLHFGVADEKISRLAFLAGRNRYLIAPISEHGLPVSVLREMAAMCQTRLPVEIPFNAQTGHKRHRRKSPSGR